jgi:hypothetical protein
MGFAIRLVVAILPVLARFVCFFAPAAMAQCRDGRIKTINHGEAFLGAPSGPLCLKLAKLSHYPSAALLAFVTNDEDHAHGQELRRNIIRINMPLRKA